MGVGSFQDSFWGHPFVHHGSLCKHFLGRNFGARSSVGTTICVPVLSRGPGVSLDKALAMERSHPVMVNPKP